MERSGISVDRARSMIAEQLSPRIESLLSALLGGLLDVVTGVSSLLLHLLNAIIVPFLAFYLLLDFPLLTARLLEIVPAARREDFSGRARKIDFLLGRYFRGAIAVALIQGILSTIVLWFLGVRFPLVLGIMTTLLNFIPYLGLLTTMVVASVVAVLSGEPVVARVAGVVVLYLGQKLLEATVLGPKIIGKQVGLHPVLLILCLLVFGYFLGFVGLLIAVPVTALLVAGFDEWLTARAAPGELG
jgi:predicted PurR-regulated permease PerM